MRKLSFLFFICTFVATAFAEPFKMANIVCFVKFADQAENKWEHDFDYYEAMFNSTEPGANSVRNYFSDMSFGRMDWESTLILTEYVDSHPRGYFCEKSSSNPDGYSDLDLMLDTRTKTLVKDMCEYLSDKLPEDVVLDANSDGTVDNIVIIFNGNSEKTSNNMLWPANNTAPSARLKGLNVKNYLKVFDGANGYNYYYEPYKLHTGVLCHEMTHTLNAFDLYTRKGSTLNPIGVWDLMSDNGTVPQGLSAYMRMTYGAAYGDWLPKGDVETLTEEGIYTIRPMSGGNSEKVAYKIAPNKTKAEYFMLEYRDRSDLWDEQLPAGGLLVYRVHPGYEGNGGADNLYELYVFRPNGSITSGGQIKRAPLGPETNRKSFGHADDNDYPFYEDGTRAYFCIRDVKKTDDGISFHFYPNITGTSAVTEIDADTRDTQEIYNLQGIKLDRITSPGLYIINGKKTLIK